MSTTPDDQRWTELVRVIENLSAQVHAFADAGGRESDRVTGLEGTTRQIQAAVPGLTHRQGSGAAPSGERYESNSLVGKNVVPEGHQSHELQRVEP